MYIFKFHISERGELSVKTAEDSTLSAAPPFYKFILKGDYSYDF